MPRHYPEPPSMGEIIVARLKEIEDKLDKIIEKQTERLEISDAAVEPLKCLCTHTALQHDFRNYNSCTVIGCYCLCFTPEDTYL